MCERKMASEPNEQQAQMSEKLRAVSRRSTLLASGFAVCLLAGALLEVWFVGQEMLRMERLRKNGVVVHGWVLEKRDWSYRPRTWLPQFTRLLREYTVKYEYWPDHDFDKPYHRAGPPPGLKEGEEFVTPEERKHEAKLKAILAHNPPPNQKMLAEKWLEMLAAVRKYRSHWPASREPVTCPHDDPTCLSESITVREDVPDRVYEAIGEGTSVPVTLIPCEPDMTALGRVSVWRVWWPARRDLPILLAAFLVIACALFVGARGAIGWLARLHMGDTRQAAI